MARLIQQLTEAKIRALTTIGLYHDGAGLYLQIRPGGARSWIYRYRLNGRTRDQGLGALADVSLVKVLARRTQRHLASMLFTLYAKTTCARKLLARKSCRSKNASA